MDTTATKTELRRRVGRVALDLFLEQGFKETTVDQIADVAGISRRTFFRYFRNKEEALFSWASEMGEEMARSAAGQQAGAPAFAVLRSAFQVLVTYVEADSPRFRKLMTLLDPDGPIPGLRSMKQELWVQDLTKVLAGRGGTNDVEVAGLYVAIAFAALDWSLSQWRARADRGLAAYLDLAFGTIRSDPSGSVGGDPR